MYVFITRDYKIIAKGKSKKKVLYRVKKLKHVKQNITVEDLTIKDDVLPENGAIVKASKKIYKSFLSKAQKTFNRNNQGLDVFGTRVARGSTGHASTNDIPFSMVFVDDEFMVISQAEMQLIEDCIYHFEMRELFDLSDDLF